MPEFSETSKKNLRQCHTDLQKLFNEVIKGWDCSVVCGHRGQEEQDLAYESGKSQVKWPNGKHNKTPSMAADVVPYIKGVGPSWNLRRVYFFAGYVKAIAEELNIQIRCGADWDMDNDPEDQTFHDPAHFELA